LARSKKEPGRRTQVVSARSHRRTARGGSRGPLASTLGTTVAFAIRFARPLAFLFSILVCVVVYNVASRSRAFELHRVEVKGASESLTPEIEQTVRRAVGQSRLLDVNLATVKQRVESIARVSSAWVSRILPDAIRIDVTERHPAVLVRRENNALVWLDDAAVELGDVSSVPLGDGSEIPPIARGFSEGTRSTAAVAEDRERIKKYQEIQTEFTEGPNPIWSLIDQIDLAFIQDVNVRLVKTSITVHLASHDFRNRMETALRILDAIKRGDKELLGRFRVQDPDKLIKNADHIVYIDAARPDRIVLNFSSPAAEKPGKKELKQRKVSAKKPSAGAEPSLKREAEPGKKRAKKSSPGDGKRSKQDVTTGKAPGKQR
jgi:hypothetical protein